MVSIPKKELLERQKKNELEKVVRILKERKNLADVTARKLAGFYVPLLVKGKTAEGVAIKAIKDFDAVRQDFRKLKEIKKRESQRAGPIRVTEAREAIKRSKEISKKRRRGRR